MEVRNQWEPSKGRVKAEKRPDSANYSELNLSKHRTTTLALGTSYSQAGEQQFPGTPRVTVSLKKPLLTTSGKETKTIKLNSIL